MTALILCTGCQYGDHSSHVEVTQPVPEGILGGARCPCKGECRAKPSIRPMAMAIKVSPADQLHIDEMRHRSYELAVARGHINRWPA